jgi:putative transposase
VANSPSYFGTAPYEAKYPQATECLVKDRGVLLSFYDFPAEHWRHIRTTNPIEGVFATVRLRHTKTKGSGSRTACLAMVWRSVPEKLPRSGLFCPAR